MRDSIEMTWGSVAVGPIVKLEVAIRRTRRTKNNWLYNTRPAAVSKFRFLN